MQRSLQREIIRFNGHPVNVRLDSAPAKAFLKDSQRGPQYQLIVNRNTGIMWLEPEAHAALLHSGADAGDEVSIQNRNNRWEVKRLSDAQEADPPHGNGHRWPPPPLPDRVYAKPTNGDQPVSSQLAGCLCATIDAFAAAQDYATSKGLDIQFGPEDIRAGALTVYIGQQRNAGGAR